LFALKKFASYTAIQYFYNAVGVEIVKAASVDQTEYLDGFQYQKGRLKFF
jgi:hypothetical protein